VRWFDYGSKDDTWEPLKNLPRNLVVLFLRQKKKHVPGFEWQTPTRRSRRQAGLTTVTNIVMESTWIPTIQHVHVTGDGVIHADVSWTESSTAVAIKEVIPVAWLKSTLPSMTRNFAYDPQLALRHFSSAEQCLRPVHICVSEIRTGDTDRERSPCTSAPQRVSGTSGTTLGLSPSTLGNNHRGSIRGNTTMDQHQLVRYCHTCML